MELCPWFPPESSPTLCQVVLALTSRFGSLTEQEKEMRLNLGLQKLIQGAKDVAAMKIVLAEEQKKLEVATAETMKMLSSLEVSSAEARKEGDQARRNRRTTLSCMFS